MHKAKISDTKRSTTMSRRSTKRRRTTKRRGSTTSSSSSSSSSGDSKKSQNDSCEEEGEEEDFLEDIYDTDNESVNEEEEPITYILCLPLEEEVDFFEAFGDIPDVDNVSDDISIVTWIPWKPEDDDKDLGKFVDPLTGGDIRSSDSKSTVESTVDVPDELDEDIEEEKVSLNSDDLLLPDDRTYDEDDEIKKVTEAEDTLEQFMEMETKKTIVFFEDIDWEAVARDQEQIRVEQNTLDFITELINKAVETVEFVSPETILRKSLDKYLLMLEMHRKVPIYNKDRFVLQFLNRKVIEYFRRKRSFRAILPDNPKAVAHEKYKYKYAVDRLDHLLEREAKLKKSSKKLIENLNKEYDQAKEDAQTEIDTFASMVKTYLFRENNPRINGLVELLLNRMNRHRKEVNAVRFEMLTRLHNKAHLAQTLAGLEDLGNGLSMRDFGSLQAETQTLGKKIEERNAELERCHIRCHSDIHTMAHFKEKQKMLRNIIATQKSVLKTVTHDKYAMREKIHYLKLRHKKLRQQIRDLSFQGGLLDKPVLMMDYDATMEKISKQTAIVEELRKNLIATQNKVEKIIQNHSEKFK